MSVVIGAIGFAFLALTVLPVPAAAYSMVAVIETQTQGPLACGNTARGLEGTQPLLGISDEILLPAAEGPSGGSDPTGPLHVRPFVVIKELDRCTPPLFLALVNRERIRLVEIRLFDRQGVHFFTIRLEDALVTRIARQVRSHGLHEEVAFTYRAIQLIDERSGASAAHQLPG
jgi:type VI secretion system secreted protein Hcp